MTNEPNPQNESGHSRRDGKLTDLHEKARLASAAPQRVAYASLWRWLGKYLVRVIVIFLFGTVTHKVIEHFPHIGSEKLRLFNDSFVGSVESLEPFHLSRLFYGYIWSGPPSVGEGGLPSTAVTSRITPETDFDTESRHWPELGFKTLQEAKELRWKILQPTFSGEISEFAKMQESELSNQISEVEKKVAMERQIEKIRTASRTASAQEETQRGAVARVGPAIMFTVRSVISGRPVNMVIALIALGIGILVLRIVDVKTWFFYPLLAPIIGSCFLFALLQIMLLAGALFRGILEAAQFLAALSVTAPLFRALIAGIIMERDHAITGGVIKHITRSH